LTLVAATPIVPGVPEPADVVAGERTRAIGTDKVLVKDDGAVVVHASSPMPDWRATRYRKTAVVFEDRTYFVATRTTLPGGWCRYLLQPWPEDLHDSPARTVLYDEAYVLEREERRRAQQKHEVRAVGLFAVAWLLGFLPSGLKLRLNERYAIDPGTATRQSLFIQYLVALGLLTVFAIGFVAGALGPAFGAPSGAASGAVFTGLFRPTRLLLTVVVLALDATIRTDRLQRGSMRQYGFGEWIFRRLGPRD
jgi:hypothetical protein